VAGLSPTGTQMALAALAVRRSLVALRGGAIITFLMLTNRGACDIVTDVRGSHKRPVETVDGARVFEMRSLLFPPRAGGRAALDETVYPVHTVIASGAKQSWAAEYSSGRDCFVAAKRNSQ
jgi:hypothetical protein